jgi:hypothetical protein
MIWDSTVAGFEYKIGGADDDRLERQNAYMGALRGSKALICPVVMSRYV